MSDDFEGAAYLCERLAVHKQADNPNDPAVPVLNKAAGLLRGEIKPPPEVSHGPECHCEGCYLQYNY